MTTHWTERLSEYLDDELTGDERAACEGHLATCPACREVLGELRMVIATAREDADQDPTADLWPALLQQISHAPARAGASRQFVFTLPQLALAASLLVAVSAGVAYLAANRALSQPGVQETPVQAFAEPFMPASADVEPANFADAQYDEAVADLEQILGDLRDELNPQTVMVIERNLASIDQAIREARAALDADPANTFLNSHLADARRKKLDLLRRATMIHSSSGD
ncbi:MAG TPA: zf-HC2 domain-containing protein [Vicinamibacterales bacterium]|nr:zf-HC2 domain-containing protein [Vicinamibacterales bacterium]